MKTTAYYGGMQHFRTTTPHQHWLAVERDELMARLHGQGWSHARIARKFGMTAAGVRKALARNTC